MIEYYTFGTINGQSISIALEEMRLPYKLHVIDLMNSEQKSKEFLKINPTGRIPVIVDHDSNITLSQTAAILIYLAEKSMQCYSDNLAQKTKIQEWLMFHSTDIAPNVFNNFYLKALIKPPQVEAASFIKNKLLKHYAFFDQQLANSKFICGESLSIADISMFPSVSRLINDCEKLGYSHIKRWYEDLSARPSFKSGMEI